jgi:3',5'-cyclic AMP phosphodiesterase CpdA
MTRIAHLSDLHLLEDGYGAHDRPSVRNLSVGERLRRSFLTIGRESHAALHRARFADALEAARRARADHVVITGDLTEEGLAPQFEVLAEVLWESGWSSDQITLVPGNHDAYERADAFDRALAGPLRPYAGTSRPGTVTRIGGATILAVSTAIHQSCLRACGRVGEEARERIAAVLQDEARTGRATVIAMHHPPMAWGLRLGWLEGLLDVDDVRAILSRHAHASVLCGHVHRTSDHAFGDEVEPRIFLTDAVVEGRTTLRIYDTNGVRLRPFEATAPEPVRSGACAELEIAG